jgi:flagellar biosynthesis GTPase FlhF
MRSALAQVREALGPDAVILSSGKIGDEVEVVAAMDMEVARAVENAPPATRVHDRDSFVRPEAPAAAAAEAAESARIG